MSEDDERYQRILKASELIGEVDESTEFANENNTRSCQDVMFKIYELCFDIMIVIIFLSICASYFMK
jgi:hypothetical protein